MSEIYLYLDDEVDVQNQMYLLFDEDDLLVIEFKNDAHQNDVGDRFIHVEPLDELFYVNDMNLIHI